jgi:hypothetical protein
MLQFAIDNARRDELDSSQYLALISEASPDDLAVVVRQLLGVATHFALMFEERTSSSLDITIMHDARDGAGNPLGPVAMLQITGPDGDEGSEVLMF